MIMEYMSCPEAAKKWGISERRVQILCSENRIPGVSKLGYMWLIPKNAEKPFDMRKKQHKMQIGVLSKEPMYILDTNDILIASGGTAGYCAVSKKEGSPYALEYLQAWLSNPITEKILEIVGSDFENGFTARGTNDKEILVKYFHRIMLL